MMRGPSRGCLDGLVQLHVSVTAAVRAHCYESRVARVQLEVALNSATII